MIDIGFKLFTVATANPISGQFCRDAKESLPRFPIKLVCPSSPVDSGLQLIGERGTNWRAEPTEGNGANTTTLSLLGCRAR